MKLRNVVSVGLATITPLCGVLPTTMQVLAAEEDNKVDNTKLNFSEIKLPENEYVNMYTPDDGRTYPITMEKGVYPNYKFKSDWMGTSANDIWSEGDFVVTSEKSDSFGNSIVIASKTVGANTLVQTTASDELENTVLVIRQVVDKASNDVIATQYEVAPIVEMGTDGQTKFEHITYKSYMSKLLNWVDEDLITSETLSKSYNSDGSFKEATVTVNYTSGRKKVTRIKAKGSNQVTSITVSENDKDVAKQTYSITNGETISQSTIDSEYKKLLAEWAQYLPETKTNIGSGNVFSYDVSPEKYTRDERTNGVGVYDREGMNQIAIILNDAAISVQTAENVMDLEGRISAAQMVLATVNKANEPSQDDKEELVKAKKEAQDKINDSFELSDYRENEQALISEIVRLAFENIEKAVSVDECQNLANTAINAIKNVETDKQLTEKEEEALKTAREKAKAEIKAYIPWDSFTSSSETQSLTKAYEDACSEIDDAKSEDEIKKVVSDMKVFIDELVASMKKDASEAELKTAREAAIKEMNEYLNGKTYESAQQKTIDELKTSYTEKVNKATSSADITKLVKEFKSKVDEVKTAEQVAKEAKELATQKEEAKKEIRKAVEGKEYRETQAKQVENLLEEYDKKINAAKTKEELDAVVKEAIAKLSQVKTDAQLKAEGNTDPTGADTGKSDGTSDAVKTGDIAPIAGLGVLGSIAGIATFMNKKKRK